MFCCLVVTCIFPRFSYQETVGQFSQNVFVETFAVCISSSFPSCRHKMVVGQSQAPVSFLGMNFRKGPPCCCLRDWISLGSMKLLSFVHLILDLVKNGRLKEQDKASTFTSDIWIIWQFGSNVMFNRQHLFQSAIKIAHH